MGEIEKLKKKRNAHRSVAKELEYKVEGYLSNEYRIDRTRLRQLKANLKEKKNELKKLDNAILHLLVEEDEDDEVCAFETKEASEVMEEITYWLVLIEDALAEIEDDARSLKTGTSTIKTSLSSASLLSESRESLLSQKSTSLEKSKRSERTKTSIRNGTKTNNEKCGARELVGNEKQICTADDSGKTISFVRGGAVCLGYNTPYGRYELGFDASVGAHLSCKGGEKDKKIKHQ